MIQLGPTVTFGPMRQPLPILAVGSTRTLPTMELVSEALSADFVYSALDPFCRNEVRYKHMPTRTLRISRRRKEKYY